MAKPREEDFRDPADSIHASYWPDIAGDIDTPADRLREAIASGDPNTIFAHVRGVVEAEIAERIVSAFMLVLGDIDTSDNHALGIQCCLYAINRNPASETEIARRFGVTRAAVSKRVIRFCDFLKLPEARGMKRKEVRATYRIRQRKIARSRHRPTGVWQLAGILKGNVHEQRN
jgi:hypothetical protein